MLSKTIKKVNKPSNIFMKWIISYMSILIIPLITCSIYYSHSYKVIKKETMMRQHLSLENVKTQLDSNLNDLIRISTNLRMNQQVSSLSNKIALTPDTHVLLKKLLDELSIYIITNSFIKEIYVYFPGSGYIVSSSTVYKYQLTDYLPDRYIAEDTWEYLYNHLNINTYPILINDKNNTDTKLLFSQSLLSSNKSSKHESIIIFEINQKSLNTLLKGQVLSSNFSSLTLLNEDKILLSTDQGMREQFSTISSDFDIDNYGIKRVKTTIDSDNEKELSYIVDSIDLKLSNIKLISLTEEGIYYNETYNMLLILSISLFVSVLIGIIITYLYSVSNYRPLKEIMSYLKTDPTEPNEKNEYRQIKNMIIKTSSEIQVQRNALKNNYLYRLLTGEIQLTQVSTNVAEQFNLNFPSDYSVVVILRLSPYQYNQENILVKELKAPKNDLTFFIAQNILSEMFQQVFPGLQFCYNQTETVMIVNIQKDTNTSENLLLDGLNNFIEYCNNHFDITFLIGVSNICNNKHLFKAYAQANNTLEYMHLFAIKGLLTYKDTPKESQISYLDLKTSDYIINLVMSASEQELHDYFIIIYQELHLQKLSSEDAKSCLYFFYNASMRLKTRLQYKYPYGSLESIFSMNTDFFQYSLLEAIYYIEKLYVKAIEMIKEQDFYNSDNKIQVVAQYIESNYFDLNMNLNNIASHFNITPSYLSKKFREKYGISIIDYLYQIRIMHSIKLITDTNLKITDIAQMVGFQDSNAFIRIFKKYHGCTPGNYKMTVLELPNR